MRACLLCKNQLSLAYGSYTSRHLHFFLDGYCGLAYARAACLVEIITRYCDSQLYLYVVTLIVLVVATENQNKDDVVADYLEQLKCSIHENIEEFPDAELERALAKSYELCIQAFADEPAEPEHENLTHVIDLVEAGVIVLDGEADDFDNVSGLLYVIERSSSWNPQRG